MASWIQNQLGFFNEMLYYDMVSTVNDDLSQRGYPVIKTSHARLLRKQLDAELAKAGLKSLQQEKPHAIMSVFANMMKKEKLVPDTSPVLNTWLSAQSREAYGMDSMNRFKSYTGLKSASGAVALQFKEPYLPVSPYMPQVENRNCAISLGSKLGFVSQSDVQKLQYYAGHEDEPINLQNIGTLFDVDVASMNRAEQIPVMNTIGSRGGRPVIRPGEPLYSSHDRSGMSALRPFMSQAEFDALTANYGGVPWTSAAKDADGNPMYMSDEAISRVRDVVMALRAEGTPFTFKQDARPGQACIQFDNKMQFRILDPYDEQFAGGRMYDNGYVVMLQTYDPTNPKNPWGNYTPQSAKESLDMIHLTMGQSVVRWDASGPNARGQRVGVPSTTVDDRGRRINDVYSANTGFRAALGKNDKGQDVSIYFKKQSRTGTKVFRTPEDAESYLEDIVNSARENFHQMLDVDGILALAEEYQNAGDDAKDIVPMYSQDPVIKAVQEKYWRALTDKDAPPIYNPKFVQVDEDENEIVDEAHLNEASYVGTTEEIIRQHADDMVDSAVGQYLGPGEGPQFDPVLVSRYAANGYSMFRNNDNIMAALRRAGFQPDDLTGNAFYNDVVRNRLVDFNPDTAHYLKDDAAKNPFMKMVYNAVGSAVIDQGCTMVYDTRDDGSKVPRILIDDNGIIRYEAEWVTRRQVDSARGKSADTARFVGTIGQVFAPDENGVVHTKTHLFVPGYEGIVTPNKPGENKSYEERIKLRGYEQVVRESIREQVHETFLSSTLDEDGPDGRKIHYGGSPTALNRVVSHLYDTRLPLDFYESHQEGGSREGISQDLQKAIIDTCRSRVKLDNRLMEESGRQNLYRMVNRPGANYDQLDDNQLDGVQLTDGRNPALLEAPGDGMFDPYFTGNGPAQGTIRYLTEGAVVGADGYVTPSRSLGDRCALVKYMQRNGRQPDFDAVDRMCMSMNGIMQGLRETEPVGMAQMTFGFQTFEDGIVISKEFAEANRVPSVHGGMRPLKSGDKIECHGNKGVVSLIVDRNMDLEDAEKLGIRDAVEWYKANPGLDVVMSPYSAVSRFNAGMAREAMANSPETLMSPDGKAYPGSLGHVRMTVLKQTVDTKSHSNTEDGQQRRSYGAQLTWALAANDCTAVLEDSFADNYKSLTELREYLITCGMDMDETGVFRFGYRPHAGEERNVVPLPEMNYTGNNGVESKTMTVNKSAMRADFMQAIATKGGFVELPFQLDYPNGQKFVEAESKLDGRPVYLMPVMSSYMRSGQEFQSGESVTHDFTNEYVRIFEDAVAYRNKQDKIDMADRVESALAAQKAGTLTPDQQTILETYGPWYEKEMASFKQRPGYGAENLSYQDALRVEMESDRNSANSDYAKITREITEKKFDTKHNIFRTGIMANKQSDSATAVWHPDPTCPIDAIRMGKDMALTLGLAARSKDGTVAMKPNAMALVHRDPVLRGSGIRYMRVEMDEDLVGISVHPAGIPGGMDGDFDGDSVGVHVPHSVDAKAESRHKLSVMANLLDKSSYDPKTGRYKLFIADGQDVTAGWAADDARRQQYQVENGKPMPGMSLRDRYTEIETTVNDFEKRYANGELDNQQIVGERAKAVKAVQEYLTDCAEIGFGRHVISYASPEAHIQSIERYVDDGAKGSLGKVKTYAKFAGISYDTEQDGHLIPGTVKMADHSLATRDDHIGIEKAKNMQQEYTGTGGSFSIRAMKALTNICPDEATRLNYLATQGVLQSKHDPSMSDRFEYVLSGPARNLWKGYKLEKKGQEHIRNMSYDLSVARDGFRHVTSRENDTTVARWDIVRDDNWQPVQATAEEWCEQFKDIYGSSDGLGLKVNPILVEKLSQACSVEVNGQRVMRSIEGEDVSASAAQNLAARSMADEYAAPLQRMAYNGTFKTIMQLAKEAEQNPTGKGLFDVPDSPLVKANYNRCMADATVMRHNLAVRDAMRAAAEKGELYDGEGFKPIVRPDVVVSGRARNIRNVVLDTHLTDAQRVRQQQAVQKRNEKVDALLKEQVTISQGVDYSDTTPEGETTFPKG